MTDLDDSLQPVDLYDIVPGDLIVAVVGDCADGSAKVSRFLVADINDNIGWDAERDRPGRIVWDTNQDEATTSWSASTETVLYRCTAALAHI